MASAGVSSGYVIYLHTTLRMRNFLCSRQEIDTDVKMLQTEFIQTDGQSEKLANKRLRSTVKAACGNLTSFLSFQNILLKNGRISF